MESTLVLDARAELGEGPVWDSSNGVLWWVDIIPGRVHRFDPESGEDRSFAVGQMVGAVALEANGSMLVAARSGLRRIGAPDLNRWIAHGDEAPRSSEHPLPTPLMPNVRFNDAKCDPAGRFWMGTMDLNAEPGQGSLYCFFPDGRIRVKKDGVTVSNGLAWDTRVGAMYYIDTATQSVSAFDYDVAMGTIDNERTVIEIDPDQGAPDGMAIDSDGMLWIALWGGSAVGRWNPETGEQLDSIAVDAPQVTSCMFGGPDHKTLYITTARVGLDAATLEAHPHAGGLFQADCDVVGIVPPAYAQ